MSPQEQVGESVMFFEKRSLFKKLQLVLRGACMTCHFLLL